MTASDTVQAVLDFLYPRIGTATKSDPSSLGPDTGLLDLGLQSIDAVVLSGEVEDAFQIEVNPAMIFEHDTIGEFASAIGALLDKK
ncbi:acyl carrier protein [Novispirillum sp. DQ9]|uniref:acyl carrier protein n=1 Tax=Novispirillum sp. DQ9 TaxID=3398612 RepID=UPI003C7D2851